MDRLLMPRISRRVLAEQHIALHKALRADGDCASPSVVQAATDCLTTRSRLIRDDANAALRKGADLSFEDVMRQDLRASSWCLKGKDFYEGVRAVIIDKDNAPLWDPSTLASVNDNDIDVDIDIDTHILVSVN